MINHYSNNDETKKLISQVEYQLELEDHLWKEKNRWRGYNNENFAPNPLMDDNGDKENDPVTKAIVIIILILVCSWICVRLFNRG